MAFDAGPYKSKLALGLKFLEAARECDATKLQRLLDEDAPVNFIDPMDRATALHYIAAYRARPALRRYPEKREM